jgi:hypothetical protein
MEREQRHWSHHLRLLPGGEQNVAAALATTAVVYICSLIPGGFITGLVYAMAKDAGADLGVVSWFSILNAFPCLVVSAWTGLRVRTSKPIEVDEVAVDVLRRRVFFGDEVGRVPRTAFVAPARPRQLLARIQDGRSVTVSYRINTDVEDLSRLARTLSKRQGLLVEDWVHEQVNEVAKALLPDPDGLREALRDDLLPRGIVITRVEVA